ncbi:uncharacterized protein EDB93DRAFT_768553 [Suillus bovinus]|uniref:uncharacterized protein n=1 Tax=Suillus bovinus TaxID=48563 RepID=UPI001B8678F9|nr:uncharacterized protein EDB93DRAFT_768553 [Suillus bovinus]KAG2137139.1 hypothetical protein EDB93DRAFT_768553 [Suillus bovinus]
MHPRWPNIESVLKYLKTTFSDLFEKLKKQFPPPHEAPGHEKRMATMDTILDCVEEYLLQIVGKLGVSSKELQGLTGPFKSGVKHVVVTIGDLIEQHPYLACALFTIVIGMLFGKEILCIFGFGSLGPVKGGIAAWLQGCLFGPAVPAGSWFAILQHFAMI